MTLTTMTKKEREELISILDDAKDSDEMIEVLERLYFTVKKMVNYK